MTGWSYSRVIVLAVCCFLWILALDKGTNAATVPIDVLEKSPRNDLDPEEVRMFIRDEQFNKNNWVKKKLAHFFSDCYMIMNKHCEASYDTVVKTSRKGGAYIRLCCPRH